MTSKDYKAAESTDKLDYSAYPSTSPSAVELRDPEKGLAEAVEPSPPPKVAQDPQIVDWDGPEDPHNPMNWTTKKKTANMVILSIFTLITPMGSSFFAPAVPKVLEEFRVESTTLATLVVSIYVLGYAVGPLIVAPLSEIYGRLWVYHISNFGYLIFTIACAVATSMDQLIVFRFFAGAFGVTPLTIGGGSIADMIAPQRRGTVISIWATGPLLGPVVGPIAGGFLSAAEGWRWIFWVLTILMGLIIIISFFILEESYSVVLLERKTKRLIKETGNPNLRSRLDDGLSLKQVCIRGAIRPTKMMILSPICALMSLYMAVLYGVLYLMFTTFTFVFQGYYGFSESVVGLVYIGLGVGLFTGLGFLGIFSDKIAVRLTAKHGGNWEPEYRLPPIIYGAVLIPIGLFIYGWTGQYRVQWIVPIIGTAILAVGMQLAFMCINTYLIDAFPRYAASAVAANTILRSILGGVFPLFGLKLYDGLGLGWGNSVLAFLTLAMCGIPWLFFAYGKLIRTKYPISL